MWAILLWYPFLLAVFYAYEVSLIHSNAGQLPAVLKDTASKAQEFPNQYVDDADGHATPMCFASLLLCNMAYISTLLLVFLP